MLDNMLSLSRNGLVGWMIQRVSSVILAAYVFFLVGYFAFYSPITFWDWRSLYHLTSMRLFTVLALLSLMLHSWVGIWTVITDYIKPYLWRAISEILMVIALFLLFVWGIIIVWGV